MMESNRGVVAEFQKDSGGRLKLFSLVISEEKTGNNGSYLSRDYYDVDYSRTYGYVWHLSGGGGGREPIAVSGIYWTSGPIEIKEMPVHVVDQNDNPPWKSAKTLAFRKRNGTRRLLKLPKYFVLEPEWDLLDWLERREIQDETVYCSACRDYLPSESLCQHCWWCELVSDYSTPDNRCQCAKREKCYGE